MGRKPAAGASDGANAVVLSALETHALRTLDIGILHGDEQRLYRDAVERRWLERRANQGNDIEETRT